MNLDGFHLNGTLCGDCLRPQHQTPSGEVCREGHGGALGIDPLEYRQTLTYVGLSRVRELILDVFRDGDDEPFHSPYFVSELNDSRGYGVKMQPLRFFCDDIRTHGGLTDDENAEICRRVVELVGSENYIDLDG